MPGGVEGLKRFRCNEQAGQTVPQECPSLDGAATRSSFVNDGSIKSRPIIIARSEGYRASDKVGTFFLESCRAFRNMTIDSHADHRAAGLRGGADGGAGAARAGGALLWAGGSCTARMQPQSSCRANLAKSVWKL